MRECSLQGENAGDDRIELPEIHAQWQEKRAANARTSKRPPAVGQPQSLVLWQLRVGWAEVHQLVRTKPGAR